MHAPVKTQCFAHFGISCELGKKKKLDERHMQHVPVENTRFLFHFGISWKLGNRKNWGRETHAAFTCEYTIFFLVISKKLRIREGKIGRETDRRHLLVTSQCFAQRGKKSAACRVMFPQQGLKTKKCENIRGRDNTCCTL